MVYYNPYITGKSTIHVGKYTVRPMDGMSHSANGPWKKKFELYFPY